MINGKAFTVTAPIFLLRSAQACWRCHQKQEVIALAFKWVVDKTMPSDKQAREGTTFVLQNILDMPKAIADHIISIHPTFENRTSKTTGTAYYMNLCKCGANFGDFFLFSEPGAAFFPMNEKAASLITIEQLPFTGAFEFDCSYSMTSDDLIFANATRR